MMPEDPSMIKFADPKVNLAKKVARPPLTDVQGSLTAQFFK